jgi:hypothetical protein
MRSTRTRRPKRWNAIARSAGARARSTISGPMVEINLRCAEGLDLDALEIAKFDGASL